MSFQERAETYDEYAVIQRLFIDWAWIHFPDSINLKNQEVLELGAGTGLLTQYIHQCNPKKIWMIDDSSSMLQVASQKFKGSSNIQFLEGNAWGVELDPVDYLFSSHLLQWAMNPVDVLKRWRRLLKPRAKALFVFFIEDTLRELYQILPQCNFVNWRSHSTWISLMEVSGFDVISTQCKMHKAVFGSSLCLLKTLQKTGVTQKQNTLNYAQVIRVLNEYQKHFSVSDGVISTWHGCYFWVQAGEKSLHVMQ